MNGGEPGSEKKGNFKAEITFNMECQYNYQPLYFHRLLISP